MKRLGMFGALAALLAGCNAGDDPQPMVEAPTSAECGFRGERLPAEMSDGLDTYVACNHGAQCALHPLWMSGVPASLELDLSGTRASDLRLVSSDEQALWVNGTAVLELDACTMQPRASQPVLLLAAGHADVEVELWEQRKSLPFATLSFDVQDPAEIEVVNENDAEPEALEHLDIDVQASAELSARVRGAGRELLTTLGAELWWVDDPDVLDLSQPPASEAEADTLRALPPIRGSHVLARAATPGSTVLHVLAGNVEHTTPVTVSAP